MNIQIQHYDQILLLSFKGPVQEADLAQVAEFISARGSRANAVVADMSLAEMSATVCSSLFKFKIKFEKSRVRFLVVSPALAGADFRRREDALAGLKTPESARVLEVLVQEDELVKIPAEISKARAELHAELELKEGAEARNEQVRVVHSLRERNGQLLRLYETIYSEISLLQGGGETAGGEDQIVAQIDETKRRVLDYIRGNKVLE